MKKNDIIYLQHILDAILRIESYLHKIDEETFYKYYLRQDGIIRQLEIIGEAVKNISNELRQKYPMIPWKGYAGMRDKLIHGYFGVDIEQVWIAAADDIPLLKKQIIQIVEILSKEKGSLA